MSNLRQILLKSISILIVLTAAACVATSPAATPTLEKPSATPTLEVEQRPSLPVPALQGVVDVGGHVLSYQCFGEGSPAVIVEAGAGDKPTLTLSWNAVILGVLPSTRICIYDRVPITTSQEAAENLHILLSKIPVPAPYILVAHSLGGWHARVFAHLYPPDMAGMVLVDTTPTYPEAAITYATAYPTYSPGEPAGITQYRMSETAIYTGSMMPSMDGLDMQASNEQVRQAGSFGDIPLIVIGHNPGPNDWRGLEPAAQEQYAEIIRKLQADLATLSSQGVSVTARTSQHFISLYEPQIIIDAIIHMVEKIRNP